MQRFDDPLTAHLVDEGGRRGDLAPRVVPQARRRRVDDLLHLALSAQARDARRRERLAERLERLAGAADAPAAVQACEPRILLVGAVLRSHLPLPVDGVAAVRAWTRDRQGSLHVDGDEDLLDDLRDIEQALGMRGSHRRAAQAIAAGEVVVLRSSGDA